MILEINKEIVESLKEAIQSNNNAFIKEMLEGVHAVDIVSLFEEYSSEDQKYLLGFLPSRTCASILSEMDSQDVSELMVNFSSQELAEIMDLSDSDDAADVLQLQPVKIREEVIALLKNKEKASHIIELLRYDDDCAGGLMEKEFITVKLHWDANRCIEEIRSQAKRVERIYSMYATNEKGILKGRLPIKRLLLAKDDALVKDIYIEDIISVPTYMHETEVADIMQKYDLEAVPVTNVKGKLLGRITIDDIIDVITETAERDRQMMAGITEDVEEDDSVWRLSRARLPWLLVGMLGGLLGAQFLGFFEKDLIAVPAMAFFIPLITATGGNVGIQSSTIIVQALAGNNMGLQESLASRLFKSMSVAIINGVVIAICVFTFNVFFSNVTLALVVSFALFSVVIIASLMGTITPIILNRFGINPALASGPFITTANDLMGLAVYFMVAQLLFSL